MKRPWLVAFVAARAVQALILLLAVIAIDFILIKLSPGDPAALFIRDNSSPQYVAHIRHVLGLDLPAYVQFLSYLGDMVHLDWGISIYYQQPVLPLILSRMPATLLLAGVGLVFSSVVGVVLGAAARRTGSVGDYAASMLSLAGYSMPTFWLAQILLMVFALQLGWLPAGGMIDVRNPTQGLSGALGLLQHLVLPLVAYSAGPLGVIFLLTRARMRETLRADFITTARAKGLREAQVVYRHALPNAILPVLTVIGNNFGFMLAGAILVETVFSWPGMGRLLAQAVLARDYPLILGIFTLTAALVIVANTLTDVLYGAIDPRIGDSMRRRAHFAG